jgi:hypothetical protein
MSTGKKILLLSILVFPSLLYFFFELSEANFTKMAYYGPKKFTPGKQDTAYYSVSTNGFLNKALQEVWIDTVNYPVFIIGFLDEEKRSEGYMLTGLLGYTQHEPEKLKYLDIFFVSSIDSSQQLPNRKAELNIRNEEIKELYCLQENFSDVRARFFHEKPIHVFNYFFALVDKNRNIRGYYDPTFVSEMKRMIQEFQHLKLRDEKGKLIKKNTIEKR